MGVLGPIGSILGDQMKIIIIDGHAISRFGLRLTLIDSLPDVETVEFCSASDASCKASEHIEANLALMVIRQSKKEIEAEIEKFSNHFPRTPLFLLSTTSFDDLTAITIQDGIKTGYILSKTILESLPNIIHLVTAHADDSCPICRERPSPIAVTPDKPSELAASACNIGQPYNLTRRQNEVMLGVASGKTNKEIARDLDIFEGTVKAHLRSLMMKFNVRNRTQLAIRMTKP